MAKVDMIPVGMEWQKTDSFSIRDVCDLTLLEVVQLFNDHLEKHGPDAKLSRMGADYFAVEKYLPTYTKEQNYQILSDWAKEFDRKAAENVKQRYDDMLKKKNKK